MIRQIVSNEDVWIVQTYIELVSRGLRATVGPIAKTGKINIVDGINLWPKAFAPDLFVVGCRGDGHYPAFCQIVIQQNNLSLIDQPAIYLPQWPQPGIIPRDPKRIGVSTLGFFGHASVNLAPEFRSATFLRELERAGCRLLVRGRSSDFVNWSDYSEVDLVLSVRNIPHAHLLHKPISKLSNAWLAQVPALVGREPAIESIRTGPLDCILVASTEDVLAAIRRLRDDPALYQRMVEHGTERATAFNTHAVASGWLGILEKLRSAFGAWHQLTSQQQRADFERRVQAYHHHMLKHARTVHSGYVGLGFESEWWSTRDQ